MTAELYVADSGGTTRHITKIYVADASNVVHLVQQIYVADSGGTTRLVYLYGNTFALTVGGPVASNYGYAQGSFGSITPTTFYGGQTLNQLTTITGSPFTMSLFINASGGLTQSFFTTMTITPPPGTGVGTYTSAAATYTGGGTSALWTWAPGFNFSTWSGQTVTVLLT